VALQPGAVLLVAILFLWGLQAEGVWVIFLHLLAFFVTAMVCHGELAQDRPSTAHLTEYYLWIAVGGVLGGIFNAIVAPLLFTGLTEYPLILVLACLLRPRAHGVSSAQARWLDFILPAILAVLLVAVIYDLDPASSGGKITTSMLMVSCAAGMAGYAFASRPLRLALGVGAMMVAGMLYSGSQFKVLHAERSFFGVMQVLADQGDYYHMFYHGTTLHGAQSTEPERRREPLTYYLPGGPIGQIFDSFRATETPRTVAIVGLGAGSLSCYAAYGDQWDFFEIDPAVELIARNPKYFTYYQDCPARKRVILGDARLSLVQIPDNKYGLIIFDAFSSDAVPIHLVNREALQLYLQKLAPGGILVFHISNRYLDLKPVLGNLAQDAGLAALIQSRELTEEEENAFYVRTTWVVMARQAEDLGFMMHQEEWEQLPGEPGARLWTDDFSNITRLILWPSFDAPRKLWEKLSPLSFKPAQTADESR
jgi:SAM-dependent methyltransferase